MFTTASSPPTLSTTTTTATTASSASPASPTRPSRLRGLSYLRNYTHNHLHSRESSTSSTASASRPFTLIRATSYPSPTNTPPASRAGADITPTPRSPAPPPQRSTATETNNSASPTQTQDNPSTSTSGWLPTVGGQSVVSRIASQPQSTDTSSTSALLASTGSEEAPVSNAMGRTRSATTSRAAEEVTMSDSGAPQPRFGSVPAQSTLGTQGTTSSLPSIRFSQHQDARAPRPSLIFSPMQRTLPTGKEIIRVGRYSEREQIPNQPYNVPSAAPVGFKSKVVSRRHCEFWSQDGTWWIKDVKSSSGTFLNHVRLSSPGQESKPFAVKDGDIVQLGIDFKGGEEMIFRCVKIRVELNRNWQNSLNTFNVASHKRLRNMAKQNASPAGGAASSSQDCSICLGAVAPCQALFVAPCSHTWHYKCVRRILNGPMWPQFICPNCRAVADLEAEVDEPYDDGDWEEVEAEVVAATETPIVVQPQAPASADAEAEVLSEEEAHHTGPTHLQVEDSVDTGTTDESDTDLAAANTALNNMNLNSEGPPNPNTLSLPGRNGSISNNATTSPIPISSRHGSVSARSARSARREDRTPEHSRSPSGRLQAPGSVDLAGTETIGPDGPMTPRNDAGPFVFDGSGGRGGEVRIANPAQIASANLAAVAVGDETEMVGNAKTNGGP